MNLKSLNTLKEIYQNPIVATAINEAFKKERALGKYTLSNKEIDNSSLLYYLNNDYSPEQIYMIALGILEGIDITIYGKKEFSADQMREIRFGLLHGINILEKIDFRYNSFQMHEVRVCIEDGLDSQILTNPRLSWLQMQEIRRLIENGLLDEAKLKAEEYIIKDYDYEAWAMDYNLAKPYKPYTYIKQNKTTVNKSTSENSNMN